MYLLVILAKDKVLAWALLEVKEFLRNLCGCLLNYVEADMAAHTAKCLGSVQPFCFGRVCLQHLTSSMAD